MEQSLTPFEQLRRELFAARATSKKITFVLAHPDDETIGAGAQLRRWRHAQLIYVTDGSPRNLADAQRAGFGTRTAYAEARSRELLEALELTGISGTQVRNLGVPDQEVSWGMVRTAVRLEELLEGTAPEIVITHPYEGGHPDHDATALAVHLACSLLKQKPGATCGGIACRTPRIWELTSYHNQSGSLCPSRFLPNGNSSVVEHRLNASERELKAAMFRCFRTQSEVLQYFPIEKELFRPAPEYDFTAPPHKGTLYYDLFDWGIKAEQWRKNARTAIAVLNLSEPCASPS